MKPKRVIFSIFFTLAMAVLSLLLLFYITPMPNQQKNGFDRVWLNDIIPAIKEKAIELPYVKICGMTDKSIFLSLPNPQWLVMLDHDLNIKDTIPFPADIRNERLTQLFNFSVDSPWVFLFANNVPAYIYGHIYRAPLDTVRPMFIKSIFSRSAYMTPEKFVIRTLDSIGEKQVLQKIDVHTGRVLNEQTIVEYQSALGFSSDGTLLFDQDNQNVVYLLNYQNKYYNLDSNLNLKYVGKTIDTIATNTVEMSEMVIDGKNKLMPTKPRVTVNKSAVVSNGLLFVHSGLKSDNESYNSFRTYPVIDIYDIKNNFYKGSFYVPTSTGKNEMKSFFIKNNVLVGLFNENVLIAKLNI